jgi:DNA-binding response OmpR family regulator
MRLHHHHAAPRGNDRSMFLQASASDESERVARRTLRVVIVDDDPDTVDTLSVVLQHEGHEVVGVYDSAQALAMTRKMKPDAVILDIGMPGLNGYDVARALKAEHGERCPTLIAVTAYSRESEKLIGRAVGFDYYFGKPVVIDHLISALSRIR